MEERQVKKIYFWDPFSKFFFIYEKKKKTFNLFSWIIKINLKIYPGKKVLTVFTDEKDREMKDEKP